MIKTKIYTLLHNDLVKHLRQARKRTGLSQKEVAKRLKRDQTFISDLEVGQKRINFDWLPELCTIYNIGLIVEVNHSPPNIILYIIDNWREFEKNNQAKVTQKKISYKDENEYYLQK